ncbi:MAG: hypothetical protein AVDCRST_MAG56-7437 [uncultured Cytophagales bacterium]|uniref:Uncharacterized protein n=1 Tax=uncultured Cytophagales bacterium TaxID=158755 RepID=A0A6J4L6D1_9SPHI|nr:MAG: hypothetical protein AVDCRST_MAG56-7437 [uncultured Cytophagales bacterium]
MQSFRCAKKYAYALRSLRLPGDPCGSVLLASHSSFSV